MEKVIFSQKNEPIFHLNCYCYNFHSFNKNWTRRYWRSGDRRTCNTRFITRIDLVNIKTIKDGADIHLHSANVEGKVRKAVNKLKWQAEHLNAPPMHMAVGEVKEEILHMLPEMNTSRRQINTMQTSKWLQIISARCCLYAKNKSSCS
jgi:hypothetical protein